jgi:hypothetical protein
MDAAVSQFLEWVSHAEDAIASAISEYQQGPEFFRLAPERARAALSIAAIREIKLGDEIFESSEEKAEVESAKRCALSVFDGRH